MEAGQSRRVWRPGDTINLGIGQGDMLVTPLQMAQAVATLANRGKFRPAVMVKDRVRDNGSMGQFDELNRIPDWAWETIIGGMKKVVHRGNQRFGENGTAWAYIGRDIPYTMAGKSGTAQVVGISQGEVYDEDLIDERLRKHAWFIAFAPVSILRSRWQSYWKMAVGARMQRPWQGRSSMLI